MSEDLFNDLGNFSETILSKLENQKGEPTTLQKLSGVNKGRMEELSKVQRSRRLPVAMHAYIRAQTMQNLKPGRKAKSLDLNELESLRGFKEQQYQYIPLHQYGSRK